MYVHFHVVYILFFVCKIVALKSNMFQIIKEL